MRKLIKIKLFLALCLLSFFGYTQEEVSSFYFSEPQPKDLPEITEFDENHFGVYRMVDQKHTKLVIEKDSIAAKYLIAFEITMDEVNSNEDFYIKDELLYGVTPVGLHFRNTNDTLLVALNQSELYCSAENSVIKKDDDTYYINKKEGEGKWRTLVLKVSDKKLEVLDLDHSLSKKEVDKMEKNKEFEDDILVYIATPTSKQFFSLVKSKGYHSEPILYKKD